MKTFIAAALVVLSLASGASPSPAKTAGETTMPSEARENAETKPGEAFAADEAQSPQAAPQSSQAAPRQSPLKLPLVKPRIVVSKSKRQLLLYAGGALVRTYKIVLGGNPVDDKVRQGDRATPEGDFYVCVKNARSNFHLSLGLNYPNAEDAERGLRDKLITRAEYERIMHAIRNKRRPPWDTALGGEIFIHGGGTESDWTWGCVALSNPEIEELFEAVPLGTPVRIEH